MGKKLTDAIEGLVITVVGVFLLYNSLHIKNNPIKAKGIANVLTQAKLVPIVVSVGILLLGIVLLYKQLTGKDKSNTLEKKEWIRMLTVLVMTLAYTFAIYNFKFLIPTIVYSFAMFFFLNYKKRKPIVIIAYAILGCVLGLVVLPRLISLQLPLI